jgi:hypothetical protein
MSFSVFAISLLALIGHALGIPQLISWNGLAGMSVPTAVCFICSSVAIVAIMVWKQ